ncbi:MAG: hypothetical protein Kow0075_06650 [Salibacteraceae bacterium]
MFTYQALAKLLIIYAMTWSGLYAQTTPMQCIPEISMVPVIDGNPGEWKQMAFRTGPWNEDEVKKEPWYNARRNRLRKHSHETDAVVDLEATYFVAYAGDRLYLAAEVTDNELDVTDTLHQPKRWYYKDAIAWFFEIPADSISGEFRAGDHAFCFVADTGYPVYGAWWRHGTDSVAYIEEPLPPSAVHYAWSMEPANPLRYVLEAEIQLSALMPADVLTCSDQSIISMMIVHCDPDGKQYGGHLLIYGSGDDDATWQRFRLCPNHPADE